MTHVQSFVRVFMFAVLCLAGALPARAQDTDAFLTSFIKTVNANMPPKLDPVAVANLFTEDGKQYHMNQSPLPTQVGREQLEQFFARFKDQWSDWTHIEKSRVVQGNRAVWEGTAQGHHKATGKLVKLPIVFFLEFDDQGKVREDRVYVDIHLVGEQTGKELPPKILR
jgi:ketosteroid isomerase-like protein